MDTSLLTPAVQKVRYALVHRWRCLVHQFRSATRYSSEHWARVVIYRELFAEAQNLAPGSLVALEISPGGSASPWRQLGFAEYVAVDYPQSDICKDRLERQFDVIIADQVFEHLLWPYRAARNIHIMLKPGGHFINTTPFLLRVRGDPVDCSRWTELGMKYLLAEAGFDLKNIRTGSWGNLACVRANFKNWASFGWGKSLRNEPAYPVVVWAIAHK